MPCRGCIVCGVLAVHVRPKRSSLEKAGRRERRSSMMRRRCAAFDPSLSQKDTPHASNAYAHHPHTTSTGLSYSCCRGLGRGCLSARSEPGIFLQPPGIIIIITSSKATRLAYSFPQPPLQAHTTSTAPPLASSSPARQRHPIPRSNPRSSRPPHPSPPPLHDHTDTHMAPPPGQSLFQIVNGLRHYGVGARLTRSIWHGEPGTYWQVQRVALKEGDPNHGKAWGVFHWKGVPKGGEHKIRGPLKKQWRMAEGEGESGSAGGSSSAAAP